MSNHHWQVCLPLTIFVLCSWTSSGGQAWCSPAYEAYHCCTHDREQCDTDRCRVYHLEGRERGGHWNASEHRVLVGEGPSLRGIYEHTQSNGSPAVQSTQANDREEIVKIVDAETQMQELENNWTAHAEQLKNLIRQVQQMNSTIRNVDKHIKEQSQRLTSLKQDMENFVGRMEHMDATIHNVDTHTKEQSERLISLKQEMAILASRMEVMDELKMQVKELQKEAAPARWGCLPGLIGAPGVATMRRVFYPFQVSLLSRAKRWLHLNDDETIAPTARVVLGKVVKKKKKCCNVALLTAPTELASVEKRVFAGFWAGKLKNKTLLMEVVPSDHPTIIWKAVKATTLTDIAGVLRHHQYYRLIMQVCPKVLSSVFSEAWKARTLSKGKSWRNSDASIVDRDDLQRRLGKKSVDMLMKFPPQEWDVSLLAYLMLSEKTLSKQLLDESNRQRVKRLKNMRNAFAHNILETLEEMEFQIMWNKTIDVVQPLALYAGVSIAETFKSVSHNLRKEK